MCATFQLVTSGAFCRQAAGTLNILHHGRHYTVLHLASFTDFKSSRLRQKAFFTLSELRNSFLLYIKIKSLCWTLMDAKFSRNTDTTDIERIILVHLEFSRQLFTISESCTGDHTRAQCLSRWLSYHDIPHQVSTCLTRDTF